MFTIMPTSTVEVMVRHTRDNWLQLGIRFRYREKHINMETVFDTALAFACQSTAAIGNAHPEP